MSYQTVCLHKTPRPLAAAANAPASLWLVCELFLLPLYVSIFVKVTYRFCMQHEYETKRSELLEAEQKVDELRKQLEQALLVAREKREAAVAAKRKFEAARRRLDAEMATVREKVPRFMLHSIQGGSISRERNQTRKHGATACSQHSHQFVYANPSSLPSACKGYARRLRL